MRPICLLFVLASSLNLVSAVPLAREARKGSIHLEKRLAGTFDGVTKEVPFAGRIVQDADKNILDIKANLEHSVANKAESSQQGEKAAASGSHQAASGENSEKAKGPTRIFIHTNNFDGPDPHASGSGADDPFHFGEGHQPNQGIHFPLGGGHQPNQGFPLHFGGGHQPNPGNPFQTGEGHQPNPWNVYPPRPFDSDGLLGQGMTHETGPKPQVHPGPAVGNMEGDQPYVYFPAQRMPLDQYERNGAGGAQAMRRQGVEGGGAHANQETQAEGEEAINRGNRNAGGDDLDQRFSALEQQTQHRLAAMSDVHANWADRLESEKAQLHDQQGRLAKVEAKVRSRDIKTKVVLGLLATAGVGMAVGTAIDNAKQDKLNTTFRHRMTNTNDQLKTQGQHLGEVSAQLDAQTARTMAMPAPMSYPMPYPGTVSPATGGAFAPNRAA